jgi:phosphoribosylformylglycinamidine cyclo-ligase
MGHRMEFYVSPNLADQIISISKSFNVDAQIVGRVESAPKKSVLLNTPYGSYEYP